MAEVERRRYFRINDQVGLSYRLIDVSAGGATHLVDDVLITMEHLLQGIDHELNSVTNALWQEQPTVAKAIGLLNKKITILASKLIDDDFNARDFLDETRPVSLSACGIAFSNAEPLAIGQEIILDLVLKPSNNVLSIPGKVIDCELFVEDERHKLEENPFHVRVDFEGIGAEAQEQLIQHVVQRQSTLLSARK